MELQGRKGREAGDGIPYTTQMTKKGITFFVDHKYKEKDIRIFVNGEFVVTVKSGSAANFKISRKNSLGKMIVDALNMKEKVELRV